MESKFALLESSLNMVLNIHTSKDARILELQKIKQYTDGLVNLSEENRKTLMAVLQAFIHEISKEKISEECMGGYLKILKEILSIGRSLKGKKCVVYGDNWLAEKIKTKMVEMQYCVFDWHAVNPDYIDEYDLFLLCEEPIKAYDIQSIPDKTKILKIWDCLKFKYVVYPSFYASYMDYRNLVKKGTKVKCVATGSTNVKSALQANILHMKTLSLANNAQDLFYDYQMFCHVYEKLPDLEYAIIGLEPYSLRYDASKSKVEWRRCLVYYPIVKTIHNCNDAGSLISMFEEEDVKIKAFFDGEYLLSLYHTFAAQDKSGISNGNEVYSDKGRAKEMTAMNLREIKELYNKPFQDIVEENKKILDEYTHFCCEKGIKVIFFIPPFSEWYKENMNKEYYEELIQEVNMLCEKYNAECVDLMKIPVPDCCFADYANVNKLGAVKTASYINEIVDR